jgi:hypothetical protein
MNFMGGSSGAIFSIFFQCASNAFAESNEYSISNWKNALRLGINGIMEYGKAKVGDRSLLDPLYAGYEELVKIKSNNIHECIEAFARGCTEGAERTKFMQPRCGRSAYSSSEASLSLTNPDAGAHAIALIANTILNATKGVEF